MSLSARVAFKVLGFFDDVHDCSFKFCILGFILVILTSIELVDRGGWWVNWSNRGDFNSEINKWNILDLLGVVCKLIYPSMPRECEAAMDGPES